tara:strand:+ start:184 stop:360 length:177 start_codon:yes stop_codon:yes gene_type:complete
LFYNYPISLLLGKGNLECLSEVLAGILICYLFYDIPKNAIAQELKGEIVLKPRIENAW